MLGFEETTPAHAAHGRGGDVIVCTHTQIREVLGGPQRRPRMIEGALTDDRAGHPRIVPACSFVHAYVTAHTAAQILIDK